MNNTNDCYIGDQKVPCPQNQAQTATTGGTNQTLDKLDILPYYKSLDKRNDLIFGAILLIVIATVFILAISKVRIFGKTLGEYVKPIWYFILITTAVVAWQYIVGVETGASQIQLQVSQWVWEIAVAVSAYKLSGIEGMSYGNMFFLGVLFSIFIHGLKVSIRYLFYGKTLLYTLDRFTYGSILAMVFAFLIGSVFVYLRQRKNN